MILTPNLAIHMLERPEKYSKEDVIDTLRGIKNHYDAGQAMVYEQYLEMRRLEDADKRP
jgi:sulfur relay (sulfurtransferase) DsrF/TusC family protein